MVNTINWVEPLNTSVGSVLIYRAATSQADSLGSRSIIQTIAAKDGNGSWVTEYTDSGGDFDSLYRIQFYDGVGSSALSDPIGAEFSNQLANFNEVLRLARIPSHAELGSMEVFDAIEDATQDVWGDYGDPIKKTAVFIDSETGVSGQAYDFTGDRMPVYQVRRVVIDDGSTTQIANSAMYDVDFTSGTIRFTDEFIGSYQSKTVMIDWVPTLMNMYVKYQAALNLVEGELIFSGADIDNPRVVRLKDKMMSIKENLRPKGLFSQKNFPEVSHRGYEYIPQHVDRTSIYFNN